MTAVCPACTTLPEPEADMTGADMTGALQISLPTIHCAACMSGVEAALAEVEGVVSARVNLGLKRVRIVTAPGVPAEPCLDAIRKAGYEALELDTAALRGADDAMGQQLLIAIGVAGFAMMNVMLLSVAVWSGASDTTRTMFHWLSALIALPAVAWSGRPFFAAAWAALKAGRLGMEMPISVALILASMMSLYETWAGGRHAYFDAALSLCFFLLIGRYLDHRTRIAARSAARELTALEPARTERIAGDRVETVALERIAVGEVLRIAAGMRVPLDGVVTRGQSTMNRGLVTGESAPVVAGPGDVVVAGEVNLTGPLEVRVTAVGADTTLRRMAALVEVAETARNRYSGLADRAARLYAPLVHVLAALSFVGWMLASGDVRLSLNIAIAVLIITCPCALGLAVPAVTTAASGRLFRRGILLKNATALERLAEVDCVVFDKTGTLTTGRVTPQSGLSDTERAVLKALALASHHPVARNLLAGLDDVAPVTLERAAEQAGNGVRADWNGQAVALGRGDWLGGAGNPCLKIGDRVVPLAARETLRPGAAAAVAGLHAMGIRTLILSGDTVDAVAAIATEAGIAESHSDLRPERKVAELDRLKAEGATILMVGDGLNDTPALAHAFVSMAPGAAVDATRVVADMVLLNPDLSVLPEAVDLARRAKARVIENFVLAATYNAVAVPIALAGMATPLMAALAMSASSITVLLNALRVRS